MLVVTSGVLKPLDTWLTRHLIRRAKIKLLAKKSLESGEDIDSIPESMRAYLAMQAMESGKALGAPYMGRTGLMPYGSMMLGGEPGAQGKVRKYKSVVTVLAALLTGHSHSPLDLSVS